MANGQTNISGGKTLVGTAQPSDVRLGMTYADGKEMRTGTLNLTNLRPENILPGVTIAGVTGIPRLIGPIQSGSVSNNAVLLRVADLFLREDNRTQRNPKTISFKSTGNFIGDFRIVLIAGFTYEILNDVSFPVNVQVSINGALKDTLSFNVTKLSPPAIYGIRLCKYKSNAKFRASKDDLVELKIWCENATDSLQGEIYFEFQTSENLIKK